MISLINLLFFLIGVVIGAWIIRKELKSVEADFKKSDEHFRISLFIIQQLTILLIKKNDVK